ncbi:unnamed protein product, partial [Iphiclides podalirius]
MIRAVKVKSNLIAPSVTKGRQGDQKAERIEASVQLRGVGSGDLGASAAPPGPARTHLTFADALLERRNPTCDAA